ncbi:SpoIIE family protein phosphatase [Deltaproteobacteria bacterium TL4]
MGHFLVIGAYRSNEVDAAHSVFQTTAKLRAQKVVLQEMLIKPLQLEDLKQWISESMKLPLEETHSLAESVLTKTGGNPFFIAEFLKALYNQGLIYLHAEENEFKWTWDLRKIESQQITNNVVELMIEKIRNLPSATQAMLQIGACIGNSFKLRLISEITKKSPSVIASNLWPAVEEGLLQTRGSGLQVLKNQAPNQENQNEDLSVTVLFAHERIKQAAYSLIEKERKGELHHNIGLLLLKQSTPKELEDDLFYIVSQLNSGRAFLSPEEVFHLIGLNIQAGQRAKNSNAYAPALDYILTGIEILPEDCWKTNYEITLNLYQEATEISYLCAKPKQMEAYFDLIVKNARTDFDMVPAYKSRILFLISNQHLRQAIEFGLPFLKKIGFKLPLKPNQLHVGLALLKLQWQLLWLNDDELINHPVMTNPKNIRIHDVLKDISSCFYIVDSNLLAVNIFKTISDSLKNGYSGLTPSIYAALAIIHCAVFGDIDRAYQMGQIALKIIEKNHCEEARAKTEFIYAMSIKIWKDPLRDSLPLLLKAHKHGLDTGDLEFSTYSCSVYCYTRLFLGDPLSEVLNSFDTYLPQATKYTQIATAYHMGVFAQAAECLQGGVDSATALEGKYFKASSMLQIGRDTGNYTGVFYAHLMKGLLLFHFEKFEQANEYFSKANPYRENVLAMLVNVPHCAYHALSLLRLRRYNSKSIPLRVRFYLRKLKKWAFHAPENFEHYLLLVQAESKRVSGRIAEAIQLYNQAIQTAEQNGFLHETALAYETTAHFYSELGDEKAAHAYLKEAFFRYQQWGARSKIKFLEQNYASLVANLLTRKSSVYNPTQTLDSVLTTNGNSENALDLYTVIRGAQAISQEIRIDQLLKTLVQLSLENAGAQRVVLMLLHEDQLLIEAEGNSKDNLVITDQALPIEALDSHNIPLLPSSIVRFVYKMQEHVVLNNATEDNQFAEDPYILAHQPKSILCGSIKRNGKITGIIYLENASAKGAFTPKHLQLLQVLSSQVAISIENAKLYSNLEENIRREEELKTAAAVQQALLPKKQPQNPIFEVDSYYEAASETGGDWYGFIEALEDKLYILIGDVTGHGTPAALVTAAASAVCRMLETMYSDSGNRRNLSPSQIMNWLNQTVYKTGAPNHLMTFFIAEIELKTLKLTFANAGHNFPLLVDSSGKAKRLMASGNRLGNDPNSVYKENTLQLQNQDLLVFYTDGLTEMTNPNDEEWELRGLTNFLKKNHTKPVSELVNAIVSEAKAFAEKRPAEDDITMVVCRIL